MRAARDVGGARHAPFSSPFLIALSDRPFYDPGIPGSICTLEYYPPRRCRGGPRESTPCGAARVNRGGGGRSCRGHSRPIFATTRPHCADPRARAMQVPRHHRCRGLAPGADHRAPLWGERRRILSFLLFFACFCCLGWSRLAPVCCEGWENGGADA